jgi:hypothetical protein
VKVTYDDSLTRDPLLYSAAERATKDIEEKVSRLEDPVAVDWSRSENGPGTPAARLRLTDWSGSVSGELTLDELQDRDATRARVNRLWGNLLQMRSAAQIKKLQEMVRQLDGE